MDLGNKDSFYNYLNGTNHTDANFNPDLGSQVKLKNALDEIRLLLKEYVGQDFSNFKTIIDFICNKVQVVDIEIKDNANFSRVFEE